MPRTPIKCFNCGKRHLVRENTRELTDKTVLSCPGCGIEYPWKIIREKTDQALKDVRERIKGLRD